MLWPSHPYARATCECGGRMQPRLNRFVAHFALCNVCVDACVCEPLPPPFAWRREDFLFIFIF